MKLYSILVKFTAFFLASLPLTSSLISTRTQPNVKIEAEMEKEFDKACLIGTFKLKSQETVADCLEYCLENCLCQSFQICQNTQCQLCSSSKEDNSSLVRGKNGCAYFLFKNQDLNPSQNKENQCDNNNCLMWYNCCKQYGLCLNNGICISKSLNRSRKRFSCKCQDGFHGDRCEHPIKSCDDVTPKISGVYRVLDSNLTLHRIYCNFDLGNGRTWTLVQSYSFANGTKLFQGSAFEQIYPPLYTNVPLSENRIAWRGYRLSKPRMKAIKEKSDYLVFTCNYEQSHDLHGSDYVEIRLQDLIFDVVDYGLGPFPVLIQRGRIGEQYFTNCKTLMYQDYKKSLHVTMFYGNLGCNEFTTPSAIHTGCLSFPYFGDYYFGHNCFDTTHRCLESNATTQLWFGH